MKSLKTSWPLFAVLCSFGLYQCRTTSLHPISARTAGSAVDPGNSSDAKSENPNESGGLKRNNLANESAGMSVGSPANGPMISLKNPRNVSKHSIQSIAISPASSGNAPVPAASFAASMRKSLSNSFVSSSDEYSESTNSSQRIYDNETTYVTIPFYHSVTASNVRVYVNISHTYVGDLKVELASPRGTRVVLRNRVGGGTSGISEWYTVTDFSGESAYGQWTLYVSDLASGDTGTINSATLSVADGDVTPVPQVDNPSSLALTLENDGASILADWSSVYYSSYYSIAVSAGFPPSTNCQDSEYLTTYGTSARVTNVLANTTHYVRVCTVYRGDRSPGILRSITIPPLSPPGDVTGLSASSSQLSYNSARISWSSVSRASDYLVSAVPGQIAPSVGCPAAQGFEAQFATAATSATLVDLVPSTDYTVRVCARNAIGNSPGMVVRFRTSPPPPPPSDVGNLRQGRGDDISSAVLWNNGAYAEDYLVSYAEGVTAPAARCPSPNVGITSYNAASIGQLRASTSYTVRVCSRNYSGISNGATFTFKTLDATPPTGGGSGSLVAKCTPGSRVMAVSAKGPISPSIEIYSGGVARSFSPYEAAFTNGARLTLVDMDRDGFLDIATAPAQGGGPRITVTSGKDSSVLRNFFAYEDTFRGGLYLGTGDINGDGTPDILTGTEVGGGPRVSVFSGTDSSTLQNFFAYEDTFRGGVVIATGDFDKDGYADIVTAAGPGGGPRISIFSGKDNHTIGNFFAYEAALRSGLQIAVGDIDGDGTPEIVTVPQKGTNPHIRAFAYRNGEFVDAGSFISNDLSAADERSIAALDVNGDGKDEILLALPFIAPSQRPSVIYYDIAGNRIGGQVVFNGNNQVQRVFVAGSNCK